MVAATVDASPVAGGGVVIRFVDRAAWRLLMWAATLHPESGRFRPVKAPRSNATAQGLPRPRRAAERPTEPIPALVRRPGDACAHCARPADPIWAVTTPRGPRDACSPEHAQAIRGGTK